MRAEPVLHVVLVAPEIPPNTGNIARLCAASGCRLHLVEPLGFSLEDRYLKRAGLDYWPWLDYRQWPDLATVCREHAGTPMHYFSSRVGRPYTRAPYAVGDMLVFGNESGGLPERVLRDNAARTYTIPMWGCVRSLNLSTSVGIVAYEALRQIKGF